MIRSTASGRTQPHSAVHVVLGQRLGGDWPEGAGANVQRQGANLDALLRQPVQQQGRVKCSPAVGAATAPGTWA